MMQHSSLLRLRLISMDALALCWLRDTLAFRHGISPSRDRSWSGSRYYSLRNVGESDAESFSAEGSVGAATL